VNVHVNVNALMWSPPELTRPAGARPIARKPAACNGVGVVLWSLGRQPYVSFWMDCVAKVTAEKL